MLQILVIARVFSYINYIGRGNFFDLYKQNHLKRTMTTEYLKFPSTYKDLNFDNAPYIHAVWKLTKYKWGEGVQLPFNVYYFPQDPKDENWDLFGNCEDYNDGYMGGKWYVSTLKEALRDLRTNWPEIQRRHKLLVDRKKHHLAKLHQDQELRV